MAAQPGTKEQLQGALDPFLKPREQVNFIRRVLALHLGYSSQDGPFKQPLSLPRDFVNAKPVPKDVSGLRREYIEAVSANIAARRQLDDALQATHARHEAEDSTGHRKPDLLDDHIRLVTLRTKEARLQVIDKYLDFHARDPPETTSSKDRDVFQGINPLPSVPKEVVNSLVADRDGARPDSAGEAKRLDKAALKTKLLLNKEEQRLRDARAKYRGTPHTSSNAAKLHALEATRNELVSWIEAQLSNAPGDDSVVDPEDSQRGPDLDQAGMMKRMGDIKSKYQQYVTARKALLSIAVESPQPGPEKPTLLFPTTTTRRSSDAPPGTTQAMLIIPYIEKLLAVSRQQRDTITQKAHVKSVLSSQNKDSCQILGHLAEESQLLPAYPMKDSLRRRSGLWDELTAGSSEQADLSSRIRPWVFASDSAKIAALESVAETIDGGQAELEKSYKDVQEIEKFAGKGGTQTAAREEPDDHDVWLQQGSQIPTRSRSQGGKKKAAKSEPEDMWSVLHGDLGLIGQDD